MSGPERLSVEMRAPASETFSEAGLPPARASALLAYAIVLNYNGAAWLPRCLQSLLACAYPGLRILLVDNASTDNSVSLARRISPRIEILETGSNLGFSAGNNAGIRCALDRGAEYVALLNNDTYVEPGWLTRLVEVAEANPQIGILGPVHLIFDSDDFNSWTTSALPHLLEKLRARREPGIWFPIEWMEGSCLVARRTVFDRIGFLDPIFFTFFEECDFCRRARAAGFEVAIVPSSRIHHHRGGFFGQAAQSRRRQFLFVRNAMIYNSTNPSLGLLANIAGLLQNNATQLKDALVRGGNLGVWLRANASLLRRLPALYRKWRADRSAVTSSP